MAGTALYSDYLESRDSLGYACETAQTSKVEALQNMAANVDLSKVKENALFLFNPLPWPRKALAEVILEASGDEKNPMYLESSDGQRTPTQWRPSPSMTNFFPRLSAWVDLPPCGYKVFELCHGEAQAPEKIANSVQISQTGFGISSLKAQDGTELLFGPLGLVALSDTSDTWAHGVPSFRQEMGRPTFISSTVIEDGPVTRVTRQRARWMNSEIVLDIAQFAGLDFVELRFVIDWHEKEQILKLEVPTALAHPRIFAKVPGAVIERRTNGDEEPYQDWAAVQGTIGSDQYTLALINNSTYSYDCLDGIFRTILIRSAPFARHNPNQVPHNDNNAWQDQGRQERTFWLIGGKGTCAGFALDRRAEEVQTPAQHVFDSAHPGKLPWQQSFLEVMPANVQVLALKRAEVKEDCTIIRLQERAGLSTQASIKSASLRLDTKLTLRPWELKTLLVKPAPGRKTEVSEVSLIET
jgi:alpha-mannosidase